MGVYCALQNRGLRAKIGGAHRDMENLNGARKCANRAIDVVPESYHPHNLLGAIFYSEGDIPKGEQHFQKALALGSNAKTQDGEIRGVLKNTTPENRRAIVEYLLAKEADRYGWAKVF